jgi:hypothetical protein
LYGGVVEAGIAVDQAVGAVVDTLLRAYREQDPVAVSTALSAPVLRELDRQHLGMGNIHLAFAFARVLAQECPAGARYENGVPRMDYLVGDGIELPGYVEARMTVGEALDQPASRADAKASNARFADAITLTQKFMQVWMLTPRAVPTFVHAQSARSPAMTDDVWGVLFQACATVRFGTT